MTTFRIIVLATLCAAAAACSSSPSTPTPAPPPSGATTVNITGINGSNSFAPNPTTVTVGQSVVWKNTDGLTHDIVQDANAFSTPAIAAGASTNAVPMPTRGTFGYHCGIHPTMVGTLVVQ